LRRAPEPHPAALPEPAGGHRGLPVRAVDQGPPATHDRDLARGGAGVRAGGFPATHVAIVRLVRLPGLLPGLRGRPGAGSGAASGAVAVASPAMLLARSRALVSRFDGRVEACLDALRGHPVTDRVFYAASELGDFSLIWL